jgi:hypothetical protein
VTWDFVLNKSKLDLFPQNLNMQGALPHPTVAMPGTDKLI